MQAGTRSTSYSRVSLRRGVGFKGEFRCLVRSLYRGRYGVSRCARKECYACKDLLRSPFIISEPCTIDLKDCVTNKILCTLRLLSIFYPTRQRPDTTGFPSDLASPSRPEPASHLQGTETSRRHAPLEPRVLHPLPLLYTQHQQHLARVVVSPSTLLSLPFMLLFSPPVDQGEHGRTAPPLRYLRWWNGLMIRNVAFRRRSTWN